MVFDPTPCFVFDNIFSDFWCLSGVQLASYSRKTGHKKASQKGTNQHENATLWTCPEAPREAASRANFLNKKQQLELKMLFEFVSVVFFYKNAWKCCSNWLPLQMFQQFVRRNWKGSCQEHITCDLTRPWPRPGESVESIISNFPITISSAEM